MTPGQPWCSVDDVCMYVCMRVWVYVFIYMCVCVCVSIEEKLAYMANLLKDAGIDDEDSTDTQVGQQGYQKGD